VEPDSPARLNLVGPGPTPRPVTYREIRAYVYARHGFSPRTGSIANVKELSGLTLRPIRNRSSTARRDSCPAERRSAIEAAFRHFGVI